MNRKAVVLLSGGLDSAVVLYLAKLKGYDCLCLIFDYGQRHRREILSAKKICQRAGCSYAVQKISLPWKGSSLLEAAAELPTRNYDLRPMTYEPGSTVPSTYVPARNIIFLSFAVSCAEAIKAKAIFIGAHVEDYSGYPDCRGKFFRAFSRAADCGTRAGIEKKKIRIITPLLHKTKAQIIRAGLKLKVPFSLTWSCYQGGKAPCGKCESCFYRAKGFQEAGIIEK